MTKKYMFVVFAVLCFAVGAHAMSYAEFDYSSRQYSSDLKTATASSKPKSNPYGYVYTSEEITEIYNTLERNTKTFDYLSNELLEITAIIDDVAAGVKLDGETLKKQKERISAVNKILAGKNKQYYFQEIPHARTARLGYNALVWECFKLFEQQINDLSKRVEQLEKNINEVSDAPY